MGMNGTAELVGTMSAEDREFMWTHAARYGGAEYADWFVNRHREAADLGDLPSHAGEIVRFYQEQQA